MEDDEIFLARSGYFPFLTVRRGLDVVNIEATGGRVLARLPYPVAKRVYEGLANAIGLRAFTEQELLLEERAARRRLSYALKKAEVDDDWDDDDLDEDEDLEDLEPDDADLERIDAWEQ
jgi:hypothetical protein